jgi:hypothetical protein
VNTELLALAEKVPELSSGARDALLAAIYCKIVTGIYRVKIASGDFDYYISGRVADRDLWLTPAEWQRDHAQLLKESAA